MSDWLFFVAASAAAFLLLEWLSRESHWRRQDRDALHIRANSFQLAEPGVYRSRLLGTRIVWSHTGWQIVTPDGLRGEPGAILCVRPTLRQAKIAASRPSALVYR